jgi:hypothetical protein
MDCNCSLHTCASLDLPECLHDRLCWFLEESSWVMKESMGERQALFNRSDWVCTSDLVREAPPRECVMAPGKGPSRWQGGRVHREKLTLVLLLPSLYLCASHAVPLLLLVGNNWLDFPSPVQARATTNPKWSSYLREIHEKGVVKLCYCLRYKKEPRNIPK